MGYHKESPTINTNLSQHTFPMKCVHTPKSWLLTQHSLFICPTLAHSWKDCFSFLLPFIQSSNECESVFD